MKTSKIRKLYPNPVRWTLNREANHRGYCVGGAFCLATKYQDILEPDYNCRYPVTNVLATALAGQGVNAPMNVADRITAENDQGNFDTAWAVLEKAIG